MDEDFDFGFDEGSDVDNWEAEQCFLDQCAEAGEGWDEEPSPEDDFRDAFEEALGVRPVFSVDYLTVSELQARTENLREAHAAGRF